jgi:YrbI family 3-deoxy-D-manno-octulosonate 8-phosphate phosphatase
MDVDERCQAIELILSDVDGVLTDGRVAYDNQGIESKQFHIRDGMGIRLWHKAGHPFGLVTLRSSHVVRARASELGIEIVRQGVADKLATMEEIREELDLRPEQVCYVGDDLPDVLSLRRAGLGVAVADACPEARDAADYVTRSLGGGGAIRETIERILKSQLRWNDLIQPYLGGP